MLVTAMTVKWQNSIEIDVLKSYIEKIVCPEYTEYCDDFGTNSDGYSSEWSISECEESEKDEEIDG